MTISPIIVALDYDNAKDAFKFAQQLDPSSLRLKVGKELFVSAGPAIVEQLQHLGFDIFLDLKFHDIPNTVAKACKAAAELGVWMTNVHASGGEPMMKHVMETLNQLTYRPLLTAVTVLTSMDAKTLKTIGIEQSLDNQVRHLAQLAKDSGLDGIVCSALEAQVLKAQLGSEFKLVTPGIRLNDHGDDDQHRIMTPERAIAAGSDYLVIGRPITQSSNPARTVEHLLTQLDVNIT